MFKTLQYIIQFLDRIKKDHVSAFAAQSAYFIILSFVPFIMFIMTLLNFIPISQEALSDSIIDFVPDLGNDIIFWIINETTTKSKGTLLSITIIILLWTAGKGIMAITKGLNAVHGINETRNYIHLRIVAALYTFLFAIMIILNLVFLVFGNRLFKMICTYFPKITEIVAFVDSIRLITTFTILFVFLMLFYKVLPAKKLRFRSQVPGALLASFGWLLCSYIFSIYVDFSKNISYMYGSLAGIVILMLWLYFCMNIIFIGAEFNILLDKNKSSE